MERPHLYSYVNVSVFRPLSCIRVYLAFMMPNINVELFLMIKIELRLNICVACLMRFFANKEGRLRPIAYF